jgi:MFS family permease
MISGSMMNGLQSLKVWKAYFHNPEAGLLGAINALYIVGKLLGLFPATYLSDKYGRRFPMRIAFVILMVGTVLQGAAMNVGMMIAARFILGFGTAFLAQPSPCLVTELVSCRKSIQQQS